MKKCTHFNFSAISMAGLVAAGLLATSLQTHAADQDTNTLFKESMFLRETGKTYSAIEAMESILQSQPTLQRVRLELAVSYYRVLNYERAQTEAQKVLDDPKTPDNVKLAIQVFLAQVKHDEEQALKQKNRFIPSVSVGLLYDSNINAGPGSSLLPGGWVLDNTSLAKEDWAAVLQAGVSHTYQSPTPVRVGENAARFLWQSQANIYQRSYFNEGDYNLTLATLATGPAWQAPNRWRGNINFQADYLMQGGHDLATYLSAAPSFTLQLKDSELTGDLLYTNKNFNRGVDSGRDSDYVSGGLIYGHLFRNGKAAAQIGVHAFNEDAKLAQYSNDGYSWFVGASYMAWTNGTIYGRFTQTTATYDVGTTVPNRKDNTYQYEVGFGHNIKSGKLAGWSVSGSVTAIENRSDDPIYKYRRNLALVTLGRSF